MMAHDGSYVVASERARATTTANRSQRDQPNIVMQAQIARAHGMPPTRGHLFVFTNGCGFLHSETTRGYFQHHRATVLFSGNVTEAPRKTCRRSGRRAFFSIQGAQPAFEDSMVRAMLADDTTYRILLRSSSSCEPIHPLPKVVIISQAVMAR